MINRRKVRASLGSRSNRKRGTKSKAIPGSQGGKGKMQQIDVYPERSPFFFRQIRHVATPFSV